MAGAVDPPDHPTNRVYGITDGKIEGNRLSWYIVGGWHDTETGEQEKEYFSGVVVSGDRIDFTYERYGSPVVRFTARRISPPGA